MQVQHEDENTIQLDIEKIWNLEGKTSSIRQALLLFNQSANFPQLDQLPPFGNLRLSMRLGLLTRNWSTDLVNMANRENISLQPLVDSAELSIEQQITNTYYTLEERLRQLGKSQILQSSYEDHVEWERRRLIHFTFSPALLVEYNNREPIIREIKDGWFDMCEQDHGFILAGDIILVRRLINEFKLGVINQNPPRRTVTTICDYQSKRLTDGKWQRQVVMYLLGEASPHPYNYDGFTDRLDSFRNKSVAVRKEASTIAQIIEYLG